MATSIPARFFRETICWIIFISISLSHIYGQNSPVLEAYIQSGVANNLVIQKLDIDIQKARMSVRQAKALSQPNLTFDANYTLAFGGRKLDFPIGDLLNPVYGTLNQLTQTNSFPQVENTEIQFLPNNFQETKISFAYPLYNTDLKYNRTIQERLLESKTALKTAQEQTLRYDITQAYLQYLQSLEVEKVWQNTKNVLLELRRFNESLVKNNVATRDVVVTADFELSKAENEIFSWQSKQQSARSYFNFLINNGLSQPVLADTNLLHTLAPSYNLEALIQQTLSSRKELSAIQSVIEAAESNVARNLANQKLPDLYVGGSVGFQGFGYTFNQDQTYALAQVGLSYKLFDGGLQKSKIQETRLEQQLAGNQLLQVQQQIALEVTVAWNELEAARFACESAQKNVAAAQAIFKISNNKYRAGQTLLLEFLDAQNRVTIAQIQELLSGTNVLLKEAALKKAAGI
jgi:outer membrane protein TolC